MKVNFYLFFSPSAVLSLYHCSDYAADFSIPILECGRNVIEKEIGYSTMSLCVDNCQIIIKKAPKYLSSIQAELQS